MARKIPIHPAGAPTPAGAHTPAIKANGFLFIALCPEGGAGH